MLSAFLAFGIAAAPPPAAALPEPTATLSILAGTAISASDSETGVVVPFVHVGARVRVARSPMAPRIHMNADLTGLRGEQVSLEDPATIKALEISVGLSQRLHKGLELFPYVEAGSATVLAGVERATSLKWLVGGIGIDPDGGSLRVGVGMDERLSGQFQPVVTWYGGVRLRRHRGVAAYLVGSGVHGLASLGRPARSLVRVGVAVGVVR